jgi:DNA-binding CsgD family transcriptional regulator
VDREAISRGVLCRCIISSVELNDPEIYVELERAHAQGEFLRAVPAVPTRLLLYDRDLAVMLVDPTDITRGAMFVRGGCVVDALVGLFDYMWSTAEPVFATPTDSSAPTARQLRVLELMALGTTDERIARTLGFDVRTIGRDIAALKRMLGVSSRAELIVAAIRNQWI